MCICLFYSQYNTIYLWSDSKVVISWITSDRDVKDVYIANRVAEIKILVNQYHVSIMYLLPRSSNYKSKLWQYKASWCFLVSKSPKAGKKGGKQSQWEAHLAPSWREALQHVT